MNHLVSVIIPVYNKENYIDACIDSVIAQTYPNIEIILINDGSTDNSTAICRKRANSVPNIVLLEQDNMGVSVARNNGMQQATGQYITFLDSDDLLPPTAIQSLVDAALETDSDMTIGSFSKKATPTLGIFEGEDFLKKALEDNPITYSACGVLYKQKFVHDLRFPEGYIIHEDSYFVFRCALNQPKVVVINDVVYNVIVDSNSASHSSFTKKKFDDAYTLLSLKESSIKEKHPHLLPLFYHLKIKIHMVVLMNLNFSKSVERKVQEKQVLSDFMKYKKYFRSDLPCSNVQYYNVLSKNMYYLHRIYIKLKHFVMHLIKNKL